MQARNENRSSGRQTPITIGVAQQAVNAGLRWGFGGDGRSLFFWNCFMNQPS